MNKDHVPTKIDEVCYRSAEKKRKFTSHPIADLIASESVRFFREICPEELSKSWKQTVLAVVTMELPRLYFPGCEFDDESSFFIISVGVGTKLLSKDKVEEQKSSREADRFVRDLHAEVLAKRGLQKFIYSQVRQFYNRNTAYFSIFERAASSSHLVLKNGIKFHLYSSSQPCGNACIKRWAKNSNKKDPSLAFLPHERIYITAASEGQVSTLVKTNRSLKESTLLSLQSSFETVEDSLLTDGQRIFPIGTAPVYSTLGNIMTCSDKIAKWNALGLQGNLLTAFIHPIYLTSIIIGRKFSEVHGKRAFCCRLQDFRYCQGQLVLPSKSHKRRADDEVIEERNELKIDSHIDYEIHHPVILGTSIKFDEGAIAVKAITDKTDEGEIKKEDISNLSSVSIGANFQEKRCYVAWRNQFDLKVAVINHPSDFYSEILDSSTGLVYLSDQSSQLSSDAFLADFCTIEKDLTSKLDSGSSDSIDYSQIKQQQRDYHFAKLSLYNHSLFFNGQWVAK